MLNNETVYAAIKEAFEAAYPQAHFASVSASKQWAGVIYGHDHKGNFVVSFHEANNAIQVDKYPCYGIGKAS